MRVIVGCTLSAACSQAQAAPPSHPGVPSAADQIDNGGLTPPELKAIAALEQAHLQRTFDGDPAEKRVKRLELFFAGAGQFGSLRQRAARLKILSLPHKASAAASKHEASQSITQLELSINKKADPKIDQSTRLSNLEKKVFGSTFPTVSVDQRIARLQKTIGVGSEDIAEGMPGSMQRFGTLPRGFPPGALLGSPFGTPFGSPLGSQLGSPFQSPYMSPNQMTNDPNLNQHMTEMFDHLNQQLRQLHSSPYGYQPVPVPRGHSAPGNTYDFSDGLPPIPGEGSSRTAPALPPYMDPNSI